MITRACISINNRCNLNCTYCHFHEPKKAEYLKENEMNLYTILDNIKSHINKYNIPVFKLGFVGNGEPLLNYDILKECIEYISDYLSEKRIEAYTITNGTIITKEMLEFFKNYNVNVGFSIDGIPDVHNKWRCNSHVKVLKSIELYKSVNNCYPSMNCTVGKDTLAHENETLLFFKPFKSRITFSRMIGAYGISLSEFHQFLSKAQKHLNVRTSDGYDCTMYGGMCGAGINNIFYSNGKIYLCGNCVDLPPIAEYSSSLDQITCDIDEFDRKECYREIQELL